MRQQVVTKERGPPDVRSHVATCRRVVPEEEVRLELDEDEDDGGGENRDRDEILG